MQDREEMYEDSIEKIEETIKKLIKEKRYKEAHNLLKDLNAVDIAYLIDIFDNKTGVVLYRMLPKDLAVEVFANFDSDQQQAIISASSDKEIQDIASELYFDDLIDLIEEMPSNVVNKILKNTLPEQRSLVNEFLKYPEDSAGSLMTIEYVSVLKDLKVKDAFVRLKEEGFDKETIYTLYVVDKNRTLLGIVSLREIVIADSDTIIGDMMNHEVVYCHTHDDREDVANKFRKYGFHALPVVDKEHRIVGIITFDDIMDVIDEENEEDFQIMSGITPNEKPYFEQSVFSMAKSRIVWLLVLMISATVTQRIIQGYEALMAGFIVLNSFIPMITDTGGNAGSQTSTLVIRGLATEEIRTRDIFRVLLKELKVAVVVGVILSFVNFLRLLLIERMNLQISSAVSLAILCAVLVAKVTGGVLPIIADKLRMDPAIMASPLITTIADAVSLIMYFKIASAILGF